LRYSFLGLGKSGSKAIRLHKYVFLSVANIDLSGFYFDTSGFQCLEVGHFGIVEHDAVRLIVRTRLAPLAKRSTCSKSRI